MVPKWEAVPVQVSVRTYWSRLHLQSAGHLLRGAAELEKKRIREEIDGDYWSECRSYVTGGILLSVSFVEAAVNELYRDSVEGYRPSTEEIDPNVVERLSLVEPVLERHRASLDEKIDLALSLANATPLERGKQPRQDFSLAKSIRNDLVHPVPESAQVGTDAEQEGTLSQKRLQQLQAKNFSLSPFPASGNPFYPDHCMGFGCAAWVFHSCLRFADEFFVRMKMEPPYEGMREAANPDQFDPTGVRGADEPS